MSDSIREMLVILFVVALILVWILATDNAFGSASVWLVYLIPAFLGTIAMVGNE